MVGHGSAALHEACAKEAEVAFFDTPILFMLYMLFRNGFLYGFMFVYQTSG